MQKYESGNRSYTDVIEFMTDKSLKEIYENDGADQCACCGPSPCDENKPNRRLEKSD